MENVILTLVGAIVAFGVTALMRYLKKNNAEKLICDLVRACEQMYPQYTGEQKMQWVVDNFNKLFPKNRFISEEMLRVIVESAVHTLKQETNQKKLK